MSPRVPALVVSLPADSAETAREEISRARDAGADLAEVRFDRWNRAALATAGQLFPSPLPLIATLRSKSEGGSGPDDPKERAPVLLELARLPFRWIDLEAARDLPHLDQLPDPEVLGRIISTHVTGDIDPETWGRLVRDPVASGSVRKVVAPAPIGKFLHELVPRLPPAGEAWVAAMTTGASGALSRAWAGRFGVPFVYASLPESGPGDAPPPVEASQIPADRLAKFLSSREPGPLFGVAGHPIAHSRSPRLHSRWMRREGRSGLYLALDFESESEFVDALGLLADGGFRGLNVTHPFKEAALASAGEVGPGAAACGVANCLTFRGTEVEAENTDLAAVMRRLEELRALERWDGHSLTVVGTGGSARATLAAARTLGVTRRTVVGRSREQSAALAQTFDAQASEPSEVTPDAMVVHATTVGRDGAGDLPFPFETIVRPGGYVLDWVYSPDRPVVAEAARRASAEYEDGRRLLVYQAAASYGLWWGEEPDAETVRETLREEGCTA